MSRYRGPRVKKIRRLGALPGLTSKIPKKRETPPPFKKNKQYHIRLKEKQKLRFHYGLTERQLLKYVRLAGKAKGQTGQVLLQLLEMRLDNTLFRLGMASTIPQARQLVNHRHILVNGRIVDIPSYRCKPRDIITGREKEKSRTLIQNYLDSSSRKRNSLDPSSRKRNYLDSSSRKRKKLAKPNYLTTPNHLTTQRRQQRGLVNKIIDRKSVGLEIKELLVVEYYSRQI